MQFSGAPALTAAGGLTDDARGPADDAASRADDMRGPADDATSRGDDARGPGRALPRGQAIPSPQFDNNFQFPP